MRQDCTSYINFKNFITNDSNFSRQYAHIYFERLELYRLSFASHIKKNFPELEIKTIPHATKDQPCIIIGTIYKESTLRPTVLKRLRKNIKFEPLKRYIKDSDPIFIEDELQRALLLGNIDKDNFVTGVVVALVGVSNRSAGFIVDKVIFPYLALQKPLPKSTDCYVAFLSGICQDNDPDTDIEELPLLIDVLTGFIFANEVSLVENLVRMIIAGNSISENVYNSNILDKRNVNNRTILRSFETMGKLDQIFYQLASSIPIDVMAGKYDPSNLLFPQQPLSKCMFPQASTLKTFNTVTNPYECEINGVRILGTSGQNIDDIKKFTFIEDSLDIVESTLKWTHIAPTAPDSLPCFPHFNEEPFIISSCPHIYFAANQPEFKSKIFKGDGGQRILLITVPEFKRSKSLVLVNLADLSAHCLCLDTFAEDKA